MADLKPLESAAPLPSAHVLTYLGGAGSPTRIRKVACCAVLILGFGQVATGILIEAAVSWPIYRRTVLWGEKLTFDTFMGAMESVWHKYDMGVLWLTGPMLVFVLAPLLMVLGVGLLSAGWSVKRGKKVPSLMCLWILRPLLALLLSATVLLTGWIIVENSSQFGPQVERWSLLYLPAAVVGCLLILLVWDVCRFLSWIARHPMAEKPPMAFLPGKR